jgi:predicted transcriptional regulator
MSEAGHALISLEERFAEDILNHIKLVEFRRRPMRLSVGTTIWIYVKVPVGKVVGSVQVRALHTLAPQTLWRKYGDVSGLKRAEFFAYFSGIERGFALLLDNPTRLLHPLPLERLRSLSDGFQPPQFFQHLAGEGTLVSAFTSQMPPTSKIYIQACETAMTERGHSGSKAYDITLSSVT